MCLSTVYQKEATKDNLLCSDVAAIDCDEGVVTLTDLFGRKVRFEGSILHADLTGGVVILTPLA